MLLAPLVAAAPCPGPHETAVAMDGSVHAESTPPTRRRRREGSRLHQAHASADCWLPPSRAPACAALGCSVALGWRDHECRHTAPATSRAARALRVARAPVEVNVTTLAAARTTSSTTSSTDASLGASFTAATLAVVAAVVAVLVAAVATATVTAASVSLATPPRHRPLHHV